LKYDLIFDSKIFILMFISQNVVRKVSESCSNAQVAAVFLLFYAIIEGYKFEYGLFNALFEGKTCFAHPHYLQIEKAGINSV
jgi:hypothetical protein